MQKGRESNMRREGVVGELIIQAMHSVLVGSVRWSRRTTPPPRHASFPALQFVW